MNAIVNIFLFLATLIAASVGNYKILGGQNATFGMFPSIVSLQKTGCVNPPSDISYLHACSGIILNANYILTVAHCVNKQTSDNAVLKVVVGITDLVGGNDSYRQESDLESIVIHPGYTTDYETFNIMSVNDLAIVKLSTPLSLNDFVKPITLPEEGAELQDGESLQFATWGDQVCWRSSEPRLQTINFTNLAYQTCYDHLLDLLYGNEYLITIDEDLSLCTGPLTNTTNYTTWGDAGSPLIKDDIAYGLHSWSVKYTDYQFNPLVTGPSGLFVKLSSYISWINQNMIDL